MACVHHDVAEPSMQIHAVVETVVVVDVVARDAVEEWLAVGGADGVHDVPPLVCSDNRFILNDFENTGADFDPAVILERMRVMVKTMLLQHSDDGLSINDGMDMTVAIIDPKTNIMRFGSAYQMAILIRNGESIKLKGDRQPIGNYIREKAFTSQEIQLQKGDVLFFMSDGIKDQTNPQMEKLKGPRLDDFLLQNINLPMPELGTRLAEKMESWRDGSLQLDDMTMVGVRI